MGELDGDEKVISTFFWVYPSLVIVSSAYKKEITCRKHETPRREAEVPGSMYFAHAVHVSGQGVLAGALVRSRETVDPLAALQVAEYVGPVDRKIQGRVCMGCEERKGKRQKIVLTLQHRSIGSLEACHGDIQ